MSDTKTVAVLGAYGLVGREIVRHLLDKTSVQVLACGRDPDRLATISFGASPTRLRRQVMDTSDGERLSSVCRMADIVINGVGPYIMGGATIARTAIVNGCAYIDFANEQTHYQSLSQLNGLARAQGVALITSAGSNPGLSTMLAALGTSQVANAGQVDIHWAQGRMPDGQSGVGSLMSGTLDANFVPRTVDAGHTIPVPLGRMVTKSLIAPFGATKMLVLPTTDSLVLPAALPLHTVQSYVAIAEAPPGYFHLVRLLAPARRPWAYRLLHRFASWVNERDYHRARKRGVDCEGLLQVEVKGPSAKWIGTIRFADVGIATAYLPVLAAKQIAEGHCKATGLLTPLDLFPPRSTLREFAAMDWPLPLQEQLQQQNHGRRPDTLAASHRTA